MERISLFQLNTFIKRALALNFSSTVWVTAEIAQVSFSKGHIYLELVEKSQENQAIIAKARGNIWKSMAGKMEQKLGPVFKELLQDGTEILFSARVTFHELYGISLQIENIDPAFTMGKLEIERQETINFLQSNGKIGKNSQHKLPLVFQRIAVLSSPTAAGYGDFKAHIDQNEYGYQIQWTLYPVAVQGAQVTTDIVNTLNQIKNESTDYDAIVIIRGGGSKLDLAAFDQKELCIAIADYNQPIIVGIGHERDQSILDLVAHTALKTPTAVADFIIHHNLQFEDVLLEFGNQIGNTALRIVQDKTNTLYHISTRLNLASQNLLSGRKNQLALAENGIKQFATQILKNTNKELDFLEKRIEAAHPRNILKRGYALVRDINGHSIDYETLTINQRISIELIAGKVKATVTEKQKNE